MGIFGFGRSDNLYFPGCYSKAFLEDATINYVKILKKLDIDFKIQKDERCCGGFLDEAGYDKQLRKTAKDNREFFNDKGFKKIIVSCPLCYYNLKNYKDLMPDWNLEVEFITQTILAGLKKQETRNINYFSEPIAYYDSCYLGRYSNLTEEPRELLKLLGYTIVELPKNREETLCCGSCGNLPETNPELSNKIAINFIKMLLRKNIRKVITVDARAYNHLKKNLENLKIGQEKIKLQEFSEAICEALGLL